MISSASDILEESVTDLICNAFSSTKSLAVADLGCAAGPNAFVPVSEIVDMVCRSCDEHMISRPAYFLLFLNDIPSNDFNSIFKSLSGFYDSKSKAGVDCFVMAAPGSFHGRLFPPKSLHFVHSSYSVHWLSQAPKGLIGANGEALNKGNIYVAKTSSLAVHKAYNDQFKADFNAFLKSRSEEVMPGGNMVLTMLGCPDDTAPFNVFELIGLTLGDMAKEGLINESELDTFNLPIHAASEEQVREVILEEGSFHVRQLKVFKMRLDGGVDKEKKADREEFVATYMRAVTEPLLAPAFGKGVMDDLFKRVAVKLSEVMNGADCQFHSIVVSLKAKISN